MRGIRRQRVHNQAAGCSSIEAAHYGGDRASPKHTMTHCIMRPLQKTGANVRNGSVPAVRIKRSDCPRLGAERRDLRPSLPADRHQASLWPDRRRAWRRWQPGSHQATNAPRHLGCVVPSGGIEVTGQGQGFDLGGRNLEADRLFVLPPSLPTTAHPGASCHDRTGHREARFSGA